MKAIVYDRYGSTAGMRLVDVVAPAPAEGEVLVRIEACSVNASDVELLRGRPLYARMWGLFRPRIRVLGSDIAGTVEAVGADVTRFEPGDEVFGDVFGHWGGFAEHVCVPADKLVAMPTGLSFAQAAALPQAGAIALQGIRQKGRVRPGQQVLINGAGGGAGTFAVQVAKLAGAEVTAVDSAPKLGALQSLGADHVIDYAREDFTRTGGHYDLILDLVATRSVVACRRALADTGTYLLVGGSMAAILGTLVLGKVLSKQGAKRSTILAIKQSTEDLTSLAEMVIADEIQPVIDQELPLEKAAEALDAIGAGEAIGKIVVVPTPLPKT
ncbi:MAG: NAD(P)-dependent alcohol dehydrogenase [Pseudomonadota bacterium]